MSKQLKQHLLEGIQNWAGLGQDVFLLFGREKLAKAMDFIETEPDAKYLATELLKLFADRNWAGDAAVKERVFQLVGEAQFWMLATERGVDLERINEAANKTPDFRLATNPHTTACFEVKTPSIVGGAEALRKLHEDRFEGDFTLRRALRGKGGVGINIQFVSPHGEVPDGREQLALCVNILKKVENNIKEEQFTGATTFLVVNLSLIDSYRTENAELKPLSTGWPYNHSEHTGVLWTIAFGHLEQEVRGEPFYDGSANVEGKLDRLGILVNPQFDSIAGILFLVHPANKDSRIYGAWRRERFAHWERTQPELSIALLRLVGTDWNDEINSNADFLNEMP